MALLAVDVADLEEERGVVWTHDHGEPIAQLPEPDRVAVGVDDVAFVQSVLERGRGVIGSPNTAPRQLVVPSRSRARDVPLWRESLAPEASPSAAFRPEWPTASVGAMAESWARSEGIVWPSKSCSALQSRDPRSGQPCWVVGEQFSSAPGCRALDRFRNSASVAVGVHQGHLPAEDLGVPRRRQDHRLSRDARHVRAAGRRVK